VQTNLKEFMVAFHAGLISSEDARPTSKMLASEPYLLCGDARERIKPHWSALVYVRPLRESDIAPRPKSADTVAKVESCISPNFRESLKREAIDD
jgi:hypothetical protein